MICFASYAVVFLDIDLSSPLPSPLRVEGELEDKVLDYAIVFLILLFYCIIRDDKR